MVNELAQFLDIPTYLLRPIILLTVLGIVSGLVGVIVNLRKLEFNAEAVVHAVFPGIVAGAVFGGKESIIPYASVVAVVVAVVLTFASRRSEAGTAIVLTSFFSAGVVLSLKKGDLSGQLEALMFGRLLESTDKRLGEALIVCAVAVLIMVVTWRNQIFVAFDRLGAKASGVNVVLYDAAINVAIAAVVVSASTAIGTLLVIGYLVIPGAAARLVSTRIRHMVPMAMAVGLIGGYFGLWITGVSARISPQAAVALSVVAMYFLALGLSRLGHRVEKSDAPC
ncbi:metal ABC transporter permease [Corynebacterium ulcerans]|uniref:Zinc ABC transporter permease n=1 Tax=Corynebacterium ulcerans TaxID=65058 RepID=A0ABD0BF06_CORUL|nr:metal ABC transporter permease [Corynebacterium ulcerans]KPH78138.1 zinc ABC transporter permease [Corynebacterium ulcerans]MBH5294946.1 metal ABC transporter permease [Corynebacterium ulcerans]MBL4943748.1 metal ABC transporter permease [Corynebacterium ulcerans]MDK8888835.1 metal ABC transporter permease [Corynebacterium ulcerans]OIS05253.1 zinc ABC transporter permease [Corynebacterium ulcerans]